ncbi:threonylcarbamoyl-AMP synthase [Candidatus Kaiserbacteria bacterium RIFCSPLOWO2_01_FULL_54_24]|uniref:L-threonylcarbamoyladenylate synthase n=1 Tax=Candidatus Kaiserbacteria bacterium RIFCSPLOWO2_01_FULL_54_24 TaxID=1798515 RepID=A0A1F6ET92_9BACT|nr:MAG: threonylcarbamoyl-AMP synthase [Candidatus Kaiserbacteria bacterium RIFCSPLOWO2_01_FULL_54_24]
MEKLKLSEANIEECAARAAAVLRAGGVVLYPTDTLYGLGSDALSDEAVAKIYAIKRREKWKPIHAIVADLEMAGRYAELTDDVRSFAKQLPKGQVTFILKKRAGSNSGILNGLDTFGFRIPDNELCIALTRAFDGPVTATSANVSGMESGSTVEGILAQLGENARHIDLILDTGELPTRAPSTVVDLSGETPVILREGAIPNSEIWNVIRPEA